MRRSRAARPEDLHAIAGRAERGPVISSGVVIGSLAVLALTVETNLPLRDISLGVAGLVVLAVGYRRLLAWHSLIAWLLCIMLFIPVRRYTLPGNLPFELEPYRLVVAIILVIWLSSLLIDPRVRLRRSAFQAPLAVFFFAILASDAANPGRVASLSTDVAKGLTFFISYFFVFFLIVSVVRTQKTIDFLLKLIVIGGAVIGASSIYESRTGYNVFNHLQGAIPFIRVHELPEAQGRGARLRAVASAEHAIALSAVLVMLLPLAIYLYRRSRDRRWFLAMFMLTAGSVATVSRTGTIMLIVVGVFYAKQRTKDVKRLLPLLLPLIAVMHLALPATIGPLVRSFFPQGGLIAEQQASKHTRGSGRIADLGPSLHEAKNHLLFGEGYGTRIVDWGRANAPILDDQWLGTLLETGLVGMLGLVWLFVRSIRRMSRAAKGDDSPRGWLLTGIAASTAAFAVGMLTYDAFAFTQVTFMLFVLLALGSVVLSGTSRATETVPEASPPRPPTRATPQASPA